MVKPTRALNINAWEQELGDDFDKDFLLNGIKNGFDIITDDLTTGKIHAKNHPSAKLESPLYPLAHAQILTEIENGNYIFADKPPKIISPLGVIPKPDGGVRIIHDCSRPIGSAVNDFAGEIEKQKFQSVDDAGKLVSKNCFMAKVDLKSAYRSVRISERSQEVTGLQWTFPDGHEYTFIDKKLPFGSKLAPGIFHRISQAIRRMMSRRGFTIVAYLDDFFICEETKSRCALALRILIALLRKLGFCISWTKVFDPCQQIVFLGVEIDSTVLELRLPETKLEELKAELSDFELHKRVTKKQLQSLAGKLNWASAVVRGGRVFLRRIINGIMRLKRDWHKLRLSGDIQLDIKWWQMFMSSFNGRSLLLQRLSITSVTTDACKLGGGGVYHNDWFYVNWEIDYPFAVDLHINELEAFSVVLAVKRWAPFWQNRRVIINCDNAATVGCINKCSSRNSILMSFLRELFWLSATYNFQLVAKHVPGYLNTQSDRVSRLHDLKHCESFLRFEVQQPLFVKDLVEHMSVNTVRFVVFRLTGIQGGDQVG